MNKPRQRHRTARLRYSAVPLIGGVAVLVAIAVAIRSRSQRAAPTRPVRYGGSVEIARSPKEVFAFFANPLNDALWTPSIENVLKTSERSLGVGTTFELEGRFLGRPFVVPIEVTEYEPDRKITTRQTSGALRFTNMRSVEAVPGGTRATERGEGQTGGYFWFPNRLVIFLVERQLQAALERLKHILETGILGDAAVVSQIGSTP